MAMNFSIHKFCYYIFLVTGILYCVGGLLLPMGTIDAPKGGLFPLIVGVFIVAISLSLLFHSFKGVQDSQEPSETFPKGADRNRLLAVSVSLLIFALCLKPLGYLISTVGLMAVIVRLFGLRGWAKIALAAALTGFLSYYLFAVILEVPLPRGEVF
jgi:putative tricarboxylic transport membrane protein